MREGELIVLSPQAYGTAMEKLECVYARGHCRAELTTRRRRFWDPVEERRKRDEAMAAEADELHSTPPATPSQEPQTAAAA